MSEIIYPQVMGLFCTGYFLHLVWHAYQRRQARKLFACWDIGRVADRMTVIWEAVEAGSPSPDFSDVEVKLSR